MQCIINDRLVGYDRFGKGKTVLFLHGWGSNRKSMHSLAQSISGNFEVICVDVPGFGESLAPQTSWGLSEYAEWVQEFIQKIGIGPLHALVGHSNGGAIAIKLVSGGLPVDKLLLIGSAGIRARSKGRKLFYNVVAKTGKSATIVLPKRIRHGIRSRWYSAIGSELYDVPGMEESFKKVTREDMLVESAMISVPTLLIYGSDDQATPASYGYAYHEVIEGSTLEVVEGAGHYSFMDKPEIVQKLVKDFLA